MRLLPRAGLALALALPLPLFAQAASAAPQVTYSKAFPGSVPALVRISIAKNGEARFESVEREGQPVSTLTFAADPAVVARIFGLTQQLEDFSSPLESKHKVGFMGTKTLAYDSGDVHRQQSFNYTTRPAAMELHQIFERIANTGEHTLRLGHFMRYDRLGVVQELDSIGQDWRQHQMLEPQLIRPQLEKAAQDSDLMEIARQRASALLAAMQSDRREARLRND